MKICLVTTNEETIFIPKGVNYLTEHLGPNIDIYCVPGFTSLKRFLYFSFLLYFDEVFKILKEKTKNFFNSNIIEHPFILINSVNSNLFINNLKKKKYDLIVSYSCPQIFKEKTLKEINNLGIEIVNFHPGILPKYRGLFTNFYSIKNNEKNIGITFHKINSKIDAGDIISMLEIPIHKHDTVFTLYEKLYLSEESLNFIKNCLVTYKDIKNNKLTLNNMLKYNSYPKFFDIIKYRLKKF